MKYDPVNYNEEFKGKVAIVTGASSGIGKAIAEGLSYHGAKVCNLDLNGEIYKIDVSNPTQVKSTIKKIIEEHGVPEILVNNAGIEYNDAGNLVTMPTDKMQRILNTNLLGYINLIREVIAQISLELNGVSEINAEKSRRKVTKNILDLILAS